MRTTLIPGCELSGELRERWRCAQESNPLLVSPYCCPEYTQLVSSVRKDIWVGVIEDGGRVIGFFPFQRSGRHGRPVGGPLSDCQALICEPHERLDVRSLIGQCRLRAWDFDHLLAEQTAFSEYMVVRDESPCLDLSQGFEAYVRSRKNMGSDIITTTQRKARKLEREIGPLRYVGTDMDRSALRTLLDWKSRQYVRSDTMDVFSFPWTVKLLHALMETRTESFHGRLSALYAGDRLVAVHMGMVSRWVWHYWFPAYDAELRQYSPGVTLHLKMAEEGAAEGLQAMDLGKGQSTYKSRWRSYGVPLAEGSVQVSSLTTAWRSVRKGAEAWIRRTPLVHVARLPGRIILAAERRKRFA